MSFRYTPLQKLAKRIYRIFFPVKPVSSYRSGYVEDICNVNLIPPKKLEGFFKKAIKKLKEIKGDDIGDYLEFGVFNGSSLSSMYFAAKKSGVDSMRFLGFDSFEGLPESSQEDDHNTWSKGFYACSLKETKKCLKQKNINPEEIHWIKGWYQNTLNKDTIEKHSINKIGIVFIDCDTYSSTKIVLDFLKPLLNEPAIFCFDDWRIYNLDLKNAGESRAFNEFLEQNPQLKAEEIKSYNRKSRSFLVKPKN